MGLGANELYANEKRDMPNNPMKRAEAGAAAPGASELHEFGGSCRSRPSRLPTTNGTAGLPGDFRYPC